MSALTRKEIELKRKELQELEERLKHEKSLKKPTKERVEKKQANEVDLKAIQTALEILSKDLANFEKELHEVSLNFNRMRKTLVQLEKTIATIK